MKIIFLNCWYRKLKTDFVDFIKANYKNTNIFCFSEVQPDLHKELSSLLHDFDGFYTSDQRIEALGYIYGQSVFAKKSFNIKNIEKIDLFRSLRPLTLDFRI